MALSEGLARIYEVCESLGASDVHLAAGEIPRFRIRGELLPHPSFEALDAEKVDAIAMEMGLETLPLGCSDGTERVRLNLMRDGSVDGAISSPGGYRYRFNLYRDSGRTSVALRRLNSEFRSLEQLGLPPQLADFCKMPHGLVVVTGPTGSGKSTTLATLIDCINRERRGHIVTIEDPIEFVHKSRSCLVSQRQIGRDAKSFSSALVEALRQDPDVILVGEVRDLATVRTAITAAETGHLVFATMHAGDCAGAVERLVSVFPSDEQEGVRHQLALALRGIVSQHLLPSRACGRVAAVEVMMNTTAASNLIASGRSAQLYSVIETGSVHGMVSLESSLADLARRGQIDPGTALSLSRNSELLRGRIMRS